jgi:uncharacterized membrane protein YciS (DUF1049 family)
MQIGDTCFMHDKGLMSDHNDSHESQIQQQNLTTAKYCFPISGLLLIFFKVGSFGYFVMTFLIINFIPVKIKINVVDCHSPTHLLNTEVVFWRNVGAQTSHTLPCVLSHGLKFCVPNL